VCFTVSGRRKAQSAGESSDVVAWRSELKGGGAQNAGKERVRVGQLDDEGKRRVLDNAGDSQASSSFGPSASKPDFRCGLRLGIQCIAMAFAALEIDKPMRIGRCAGDSVLGASP